MFFSWIVFCIFVKKEMETKELRIGNWVNIPTGGDIQIPAFPRKIKGITKFGELDFTEPSYPEPHLFHFNHCGGILLTEEILLKIGFEKINHIHGYSFYSLSKSKKNKCHIDIYDTQTKYMGYLVNHCEYVHELQNLFFALTGKELEIKL